MLPRPFERWTTYAGHSGIDYPVGTGTPVRASGPGFVQNKTTNARAGNTVWVQYDNGVYAGHSHLRDLTGPPVRARVDLGTVFCYSGNTGHSTGPHLHHEVYVGGRLMAPPAYWNHFDKTVFVGQGSSSGGTVPSPKRKEEDVQYYIQPTSFGQLANPNIMYQWDARPGGHLKALSALEWETVKFFHDSRAFPVPIITGWSGAQLDQLINTVGVMELIPGAPFNGGRPTYKIIYAQGVEGYVPVHAVNVHES